VFDLLNNEIPNVEDTYAPYDIVRRGEESYRVRRREHVRLEGS